MKEAKSISSKTKINSIAFYTEVLRIVRMYLRFFSFKNSSDSLGSFIRNQCKRNNSIEEMQIETDGISEDSGKLSGSTKMSSSKYSLILEDQKMLFLEELRILVLSIIKIVDEESQKILHKYHFFLHLIELSLNSSKSIYQKINEFLNVNFALDHKDILSHAIRGNYGDVVRINPAMSPAIEELYKIKEEKFKYYAWKVKYNVPDNLFKILCGEYKDFKNDLERYCYYKLHNISCNFTCDVIDMINGNVSSMETSNPGFLKIVFLLAYPVDQIREYEKCFEKIFFEVFEIDYLIGLDFLAFSRKCNFYFGYIVDKIQLNSITVESLIRFCQKNHLNKAVITKKFGYHLQERKEYDQLCRFILSNSILNFNYTRDFMKYFIENFDKFRFFASKEIMNDETIKFIAKMSSIEIIDESSILETIQSEYFPYFVDDIFNSIRLRDNLSEKFIISVMGALYEIENTTGVSMKSQKSMLAQKLIK